MSLLGVPVRRPVLQVAYRMPPELYDPLDDVSHPLLVVSVDEVTRTAGAVTRTSKFDARGPQGVPHPPEPALGMELPGWWRVFKLHHVPWLHFAEPDVDVLGRIDDKTWSKVLGVLLGTGGAL